MFRRDSHLSFFVCVSLFFFMEEWTVSAFRFSCFFYNMWPCCASILLINNKMLFCVRRFVIFKSFFLLLIF